MDNNQKEKLKELIAMGKWNYVFTKGVLYWGGIMCVLFILISWISMGEFFDNSVIWFNIVLWGIGGFLFGLWTWNSINKKIRTIK